jgi:hypothetical protein
MSEHTTCPVCKELYVLEKNVPVKPKMTTHYERCVPIQSVTCGHCLCMKCLLSTQFALSPTRSRGMVNCPFCRRPTSFDARHPVVCRSICSYLEEENAKKRKGYGYSGAADAELLWFRVQTNAAAAPVDDSTSLWWPAIKYRNFDEMMRKEPYFYSLKERRFKAFMEHRDILRDRKKKDNEVCFLLRGGPPNKNKLKLCLMWPGSEKRQKDFFKYYLEYESGQTPICWSALAKNDFHIAMQDAQSFLDRQWDPKKDAIRENKNRSPNKNGTAASQTSIAKRKTGARPLH